MGIDKEAFIRIIDQHKGILWSLCRAYYHDPEDQRDAYQDIILQLWTSFGSFRGDSSVGTWIYRVSLNTLLSKARREKSDAVVDTLEAHEKTLVPPAGDDHVELLSIILHSLGGIDKALVVLYLEGYDHREIAQMLQISTTNVSTRLHRIKRQLKAQLNPSRHATRRA